MQATKPDNSESENRDLVAVGRIIKAHGVHGEVKISPLTNIAGRFDALDAVVLERKDGMCFSTTIVSVRGSMDNIIASFQGMDSRDKADEYRGAYISIRRKDMPVLEKDQYYTIDLVGMSAIDENGCEIGTVISVEEYPASASLMIETQDRTFEVPAVRDYITHVDKNTREIIIRVPEIMENSGKQNRT